MRFPVRACAVLVALLALAVIAPAWATTARPLKLTCPVCGAATTGTSIMSTNNFGGIDHDFCRHAVGSQPLLMVATTCPKCHYSAYADDFEKKVAPDVIKAVKGGALVVPSYAPVKTTAVDEGMESPPNSLPAWVRHDLVLQVLRLQKAPAFDQAWQMLVTSWAVRLEARIDMGAETESEKIFDALVKRSGVKGDDRSGDSVKLGRWLVSNLPKLSADEARVAAPAGIRLLRERGENGMLLSGLEALKLGFPAERWPAIEKALRESAALEQKYQRMAVEAFTKYLPTPECTKEEDRFHVTYLVGELHRRLGEGTKALEFYQKAETFPKGSKELKEWITEQKALLATP